METLWNALWQQVLGNPASLLILLPVSIMAFVLEVWPLFPSRLVLPMCLCAGSCLFPGLVSRSTVPASYPNPLLVLILNGFVLGFVSWVVHRSLIKRLVVRFANGSIMDPPDKPKGKE